MKIKRQIIISDIHGCIEEFSLLLDKLNYDPNEDRVILLGDLIDRGPDSVAVVQKARQLNLECVMGNHENKFLKWYRSHNTNVDVYHKEDFYSNFSEEDINYLTQLPSYILLEKNVVAVHAGMRENIGILSQSKNDLLYLRYINSGGDLVSLRKIAKLGKKQADAHFWTEFWKGPETIIYGHNVHNYESPLIEEVVPGVFCYGIDTGCCFGGRLTALIWETKEIIQVQAKKVYYKSDFELHE